MRFRAESLRALRQELEALGGGLWLSSEEPVYAVNRIQQQYSVITLVCDEPVATEERLEVARLEAEGYPTVPVFVDDLFRFEQLPFDLDELPATFSKFRKVVEKRPSLLPDRPIDSRSIGRMHSIRLGGSRGMERGA
jgi:deoxyribodipyrimidine photo-lyase